MSSEKLCKLPKVTELLNRVVDCNARQGYQTHFTGCHQDKKQFIILVRSKQENWGFPGGAVVENLPANAGRTGSSPGLGGSHMPRSN